MRRNTFVTRKLVACAVVSCALLIDRGAPFEGVARAAAPAPATYTLIDLGVVAPYDTSEAFGVNNNAEVVGESEQDFNCPDYPDCTSPYAVIWHVQSDGTATMAVLPGRSSTTERRNGTHANAINDAGQVVGQSDNRPVAWNLGTLVDLTPALLGPGGGAAYAINASGQIVGSAGPVTIGTFESAISWAPDTLLPTVLPDFSGGRLDAYASGLNDAGEIVGVSESAYGARAFWTSAAGQPLTDLFGMGPFSNPKAPTGINNHLEIVGWVGGHGPDALKPGGYRATVFSPGNSTAPADLGTLNDDPTTSSWANAVNDAGQIVGVSYTSDGWDHAVLWDPDGTLHDLNDLIPSDAPLFLDQAMGINNKGWIVGWGYPQPRYDSWSNGIYHAFLLIPQKQQDTTPPVITVPSSPVTVEATGPHGAAVSYAASATDDTDGPVPVQCTPASGGTFPLGSTEVNCIASDAAGNVARASFEVLVRDTTPPVVFAPLNVTANATSPSGAVVTYNVYAVDLVDGLVPVVCVPPSGTTFKIGRTPVSCIAFDSHGNEGQAVFTVNVEGAADQLADLQGYVAEDNVGPGTSIAGKLLTAATAVNANDIPTACGALRAVINEARAQSGKKLAPDQATYLITVATRIRNVLGC